MCFKHSSMQSPACRSALDGVSFPHPRSRLGPAVGVCTLGGGSGAMDGGLKDKRAQPPPAPASEGDAEPQCPLVSAGELNVWCSGGLVVPLKST